LPLTAYITNKLASILLRRPMANTKGNLSRRAAMQVSVSMAGGLPAYPKRVAREYGWFVEKSNV